MNSRQFWLGCLNASVLAFSLTAEAELTCRVTLSQPSAGIARPATLICQNGAESIAAPYVRIEAKDGAFVRLTSDDAWTQSVEILATSETSPVGVLKASEKVIVPFYCRDQDGMGKLELSYTTSSAESFPWSSLGSALKPATVSDEAWKFAFDALKSRFGTTWNSYLERLRSDANYFADLGRPIRRIDRLLQFEINAAIGNDAAISSLTSVQDAVRSARGMDVSFSRTFPAAMYARFSRGVFGFGWQDNFTVYAEKLDDKTLVFRNLGSGVSYAFTKATGSWQAEDARDKTTLTESDMEYVLTYEDGTVQKFSKENMRTTSIADRSGNNLTLTWSGVRLVKVQHTDGQYLTFNRLGYVEYVQDDCGRKTTYAYDGDLLTAVTDPDGYVTRYEYHRNDGTVLSRALTRIVFPDGTTKEYGYGADGLVSSVSVNGGKEKMTISRSEGVVTVTSPDGMKTVIKTGVLGEVIECTDPLGGVTKNVYQEDGLLKSHVTPSGVMGSIVRDDRGRIVKSVSPSGATSFAYEGAFGNIKTIADAKGHSVSYGYDAVGHCTSVTFPDGSATRCEYNARGDMVKTTNRRGEAIAYAYDAKGRVVSKHWSNGRNFSYVYDAHGNVTSASDSETGTVTMKYDAKDRLTQIAYPGGRGFTMVYDVNGRLARRVSFDGATEVFSYDAAGRLLSVTGAQGENYMSNVYDDATGRLTRQRKSTWINTWYYYDALGRIVSIEHTDSGNHVIEALQYCYDADGHCIREHSLLGEVRYGYDAEGQLTHVDDMRLYAAGESEKYSYDAVGNRVEANGATYAVNQLNQYTKVTKGWENTLFSYDQDGNLVSMTDAKGTTTYAYDTLNRLVSVKNPSKDLDWNCKYDALGNRVSVTENGVTTEKVFLPGAVPSVAAEYVGGKLKVRHVVVGAERVADIDANGETRYLFSDLIGSVRVTTDQDSFVKSRACYTAFGDLRFGYEWEPGAAGYVGTLGVETDSTGLLFMRNRYYFPALGRFIQPDPIEAGGGDVNWYRYCGNEGVIQTDIAGLSPSKSLEDDYALRVKSEGYATLLSKGGEYASIRIVDKMYGLTGRGVQHARALGGGGITLSYREAIHAETITTAGRLLGPAISGVMSIHNIYRHAQEGNPSGVLRAAADGILSVNPWTGPYWALGKAAYLVGEGVAWIVFKTGQAIRKNHSESIILQETSGGGDDNPPAGGGGGGDDNPPSSGGGDDPPSGGGGGSIMNEKDWLKVSTNRNAKSAVYALGADVTLSSRLCQVAAFAGTVRGAGHAIKLSGDLAGKELFPSANGATFEKLTLKDVRLANTLTGCHLAECMLTVSASTSPVANEMIGCTLTKCTVSVMGSGIGVSGKVSDTLFDTCTATLAACPKVNGGGAFAGAAVKGEFKNCTVSGQIGDGKFGLLGAFVGNGQGVTFTGCKAENVTVKGNDLLGGMVGESKDCVFSSCRASVSLTGKNVVGGIVGRDEGGAFTGCRSSGTVAATSGNVGGMAGTVFASRFSQCVSSATVTGGTVVGGFAGLVSSATDIENCRSSGKVAGTGTSGGFVGSIEDADVKKCTADGDVTATSSGAGGFAGSITQQGKVSACVAAGAVSSAGRAGGFVSTCGGTVSKCSSAGTVRGNDYVGGFAAMLSSCSVADCLCTGAVTAGRTSVSAGGYTTTFLYAGGFAGGQSLNAAGATLRHCYACGALTLSFAPDYSPTDDRSAIAAASAIFVGGLTPCPMNVEQLLAMGISETDIAPMVEQVIAPDKSRCDSCYWNVTTTKQRFSGAGTGLSSAQAGSQSSFAGWDFSSTWMMSGGRPALRGIGASVTMTSAVAQRSGAAIGTAAMASSASLASAVQDTREVRIYAYSRCALIQRAYCSLVVTSDFPKAQYFVSDLPPGLSYANGLITGVPSKTGDFPTRIEANSGGRVGVASTYFSIVNEPDGLRYMQGPSVYTVRYHKNDKEGTVVTRFGTAGCEINLLSSEQENWSMGIRHFLGWSREAGATVPVYADGEIVDGLTLSTGAVVDLYAVWSNDYVIDYCSIGSAGVASQRSLCDRGRVYKLSNCQFTPPSGKRFVGWACSNGRRYDDGMLIFNLAEPGETVTMTAIWE